MEMGGKRKEHIILGKRKKEEKTKQFISQIHSFISHNTSSSSPSSCSSSPSAAVCDNYYFFYNLSLESNSTYSAFSSAI